MAKSKKNKAGLNKHVSSVLQGVPIPQGVYNWRPPDESRLDWGADSSAVTKSHISSVFKGVSVAAGEHPRNDDGEVSPVETHDRPQESPAKAARTRQPEFANKVAYYRDPLEEAANQKPEQEMQNNFFAPSQWLRRLLGLFSTRN